MLREWSSTVIQEERGIEHLQSRDPLTTLTFKDCGVGGRTIYLETVSFVAPQLDEFLHCIGAFCGVISALWRKIK